MELYKFIPARVYIFWRKLATQMFYLIFQNEWLNPPFNSSIFSSLGRINLLKDAVMPLGLLPWCLFSVPSLWTFVMPRPTAPSHRLLQELTQEDKPRPTSPGHFPVHIATPGPCRQRCDPLQESWEELAAFGRWHWNPEPASDWNWYHTRQSMSGNVLKQSNPGSFTSEWFRAELVKVLYCLTQLEMLLLLFNYMQARKKKKTFKCYI